MKIISKPNFELLDQLTNQEMTTLKGGTVAPTVRDTGDVGVKASVNI